MARTLISLLALVLLTACTTIKAGDELQALNNAQPVGSPFTKYLTQEYRDYANGEHSRSRDYVDAIHFARKGLAAANGEIVVPEPLDDWDLSEQNIVEMTDYRLRLLTALDGGGRDVAPQVAAIAQSRFDCWAEQQEENWNDSVSRCRDEFLAALNQLESTVGNMRPKAPVAMPEPEPLPAPITDVIAPEPAEVPVEQAMFIVFFDWDKHSLSAGADSVLDEIAKEVMNRSDVSKIVIIGHTDSSGPGDYNQKLSMKRATAVKDGLIAKGVSSNLVSIEGRGENELLVKTNDNVREPANRRVEITLE